MKDIQFEHQGTKIPIQLQANPRSKHIRMHISIKGAIKITYPRLMPASLIKQFIKSQEAWIHDQLNKAPHSEIATLQYITGEQHLFLGEKITLCQRENLKETALINGNLFISNKEDSPQKIKAKLFSWYKLQSQLLIGDRVTTIATEIPWVKKMPPIKYRLMKRRWGSCSSQGVLTFNTQLIKAPKHLIDSVIIHELCHLQEFNHSPKFYALMATLMPDWKMRKKALDKLTVTLLP